MRALAKRSNMWLELVMPKGTLAFMFTFAFTFAFIFNGHVQVEGGVAEEVMEYANEPPPPPRVYRSLTEEDPWARTAQQLETMSLQQVPHPINALDSLLPGHTQCRP